MSDSFVPTLEDFRVANPVRNHSSRIQASTLVPLPAFSVAHAVISGNTASFTITRHDVVKTPAVVRYATRAESAEAGVHFTSLTGRAYFAPDELTKTIAVTLIPPEGSAPTRSFRFLLVGIQNGYARDGSARCDIPGVV